MSASHYAEAVTKAIRGHKRQQALQEIEEEIVERGAKVSREAFDEAHHEMRHDDPNRTESTDSAGACDTRSIRNSSSSTIPVGRSSPPGAIFAVEPSSELWPARFYLSCAATAFRQLWMDTCEDVERAARLSHGGGPVGVLTGRKTGPDWRGIAAIRVGLKQKPRPLLRLWKFRLLRTHFGGS